MKSSDAGATWVTIDDYFNPGVTNSNSGPGYDAGIAADPAGNLYAAGYDNSFSGGIPHWFVRRSADGGLTWATVDDFTLGGSQAQPNALAADAAGNVYVDGAARTAGSTGTNYAIVRKGTPTTSGGMTWSTIEADAGKPAASGVFCHSTAGIFLSGTVLLSSSKSSVLAWMVRRSLDGGATWATVDVYQLDSTQPAFAEAVGADASGNLYAVGSAEAGQTSARDKHVYYHWIIRKSSNGGNTWATVDDFRPTSTANSLAYGFAMDSRNNLFVIGQTSDSTSALQWLVRENPGGAGTWATVEDFQYVSGKISKGKALIGDSSGNVFAAGDGQDAAGTDHWLVRRLSP
jgi:hypothetical protein